MSPRLLLTFVLVAVAAQPVPAAGGDEAAIRARLSKMFPDEDVTGVTETAVPGMYEVMLGASVLYMSGDGRYALRGDLIDLEERVNLSDRRRREARREVFARLDPDELVRFEPAEGPVKEMLYVFTDIDCGYCRKMHREVKALNEAGIAVGYLAFPRSGLKGESYDKAEAVWCAKDRRQAMTDAKAGKSVKSKQCDNPVAEQYRLGIAMGVNGTPAVYTADGTSIGGYVPAAELVKLVK
ncbi:MAG: DsbC family protein [Gammaproteobacteria bacterium]